MPHSVEDEGQILILKDVEVGKKNLEAAKLAQKNAFVELNSRQDGDKVQRNRSYLNPARYFSSAASNLEKARDEHDKAKKKVQSFNFYLEALELTIKNLDQLHGGLGKEEAYKEVKNDLDGESDVVKKEPVDAGLQRNTQVVDPTEALLVNQLAASSKREEDAGETTTASLHKPPEEKTVGVVPLLTNTASSGQYFLPDNESFKGAMFIEKNGLLNFTDTVIRLDKADTFQDGLHISATTPVTAEQGGSVAFENDSSTTFQNVRLREGDVVRSHITFERPSSPQGLNTPPAVGLLKQDHTGKVTNMSDMAKLTKEEQGVVALKQAQMLMNNYRPGSGNIIIRGKNPDMANKVYAALLLLKESNPEFKNAEIKSFVPGCTGPGALTRNSSFIETHLGASASKAMRDQISKDSGTLTNTRFARLKEINRRNKESQGTGDAYSLKDGDEIDLQGTVTTRP